MGRIQICGEKGQEGLQMIDISCFQRLAEARMREKWSRLGQNG